MKISIIKILQAQVYSISFPFLISSYFIKITMFKKCLVKSKSLFMHFKHIQMRLKQTSL